MPTTCHIVTGLRSHGAERMLTRVLAYASGDQLVVSLTGTGPQQKPMEALGVRVVCVDLRPRPGLPVAAFRLLRVVRTQKTGPIVGWMYHGNLAASLIGALLRRPVVWNVRHSVANLAQEPASLRQLIRLSARVSAQPLRIVYNSSAAAAQHEALGFRADRRLVLANGFDTEAIAPDPAAPGRLRHDLGLPGDALLVGAVGRYHPMKDHVCLLRAVGRLADRHPKLHVVLAGRGLEAPDTKLAGALAGTELDGRVHFLGERDDVETVIAGLDLLVSSSAWGEGFPNVVAEAMSSAVPAVVTDVGDSAYLVGDTGQVVPPRDPEALARAIDTMLALSDTCRQDLGRRARARIVERFDVRRIAGAYAASWSAEPGAG